MIPVAGHRLQVITELRPHFLAVFSVDFTHEEFLLVKLLYVYWYIETSRLEFCTILYFHISIYMCVCVCVLKSPNI